MEHSSFVKPRYDAGGFASLPGQIKRHFENREYDTIILFVLDSFGWNFFEKFQKMPFLMQLGKGGTITQVTAQFPSTTAAQVTCLHTGLAVGASGIFEWYYYEPQLDEIIAPLLFSHAGTTVRETLISTGIDPHCLYPTRTFYQSLSRGGVAPFVLQDKEYTPSTFSDILLDGAMVHPYTSFTDALVILGDLLSDDKIPAYICLYYDMIDARCHKYGPNSPQVEAEIRSILTTLEQVLTIKYSWQRRKVLLILTADHGQAEIDPSTTIYLNLDHHFAGFARFIKSNRKGKLMVPAGSSRDMFLYIKEGLLDEAKGLLDERLEGRAEVVKVKTLIDEGYFGSVISSEFLGRVGDLVILPYRYESVWWYEKDKFEQKYHGQHGGLTQEEMLVPLIMFELSP
jgi:predicted AlkP superfamily pyrophosphatase or phosphodiesterase